MKGDQWLEQFASKNPSERLEVARRAIKSIPQGSLSTSDLQELIDLIRSKASA